MCDVCEAIDAGPHSSINPSQLSAAAECMSDLLVMVLIRHDGQNVIAGCDCMYPRVAVKALRDVISHYEARAVEGE